ncbi:4Fe-4S binding protein [bacterium]|nr:4Fe-4S binding protein [bacterium]
MQDDLKDSYGILFDVERCVGCNACAMACKAEFGWPEGHFIVRVEPVEHGAFPVVEKNFVRNACMHCSDAACMMACPVSAISRRPNGAVFLDEKLCIGCQYCVISCPFNVPQFNRRLGKSYKCNLCEHRTAEGKEPACVATCITGALRYGKIDDLKAQGGEILASTGVERKLYGESFLKGTHVLYAIKDEPEHYGLNRDPKVPLSVIVWKQFIQPIGTYGIFGAIMAAIAHYLIIGPKKEKKYEVKSDE